MQPPGQRAEQELMQATGAPGRGERLSEPRNWTPFASGGMGVLARRAPVDPLFGQTSEQIQEYATTYPMRLLSLLPDVHPSVGLALWNALRLTCPRDGYNITVYKRAAPGAPKEKDEAAQAQADAFFAGLPPEIGGLNGLLTQLTMMGLFTGLICVEGVPSGAIRGLHRLWPVDSLSVYFARWNRNDDLWPYQRQRFPIGLGAFAQGPYATPPPPPNAPMGPAGMPSVLGGAFIPLNPETFTWRAIDPIIDDPYGRAPYATALSEAIADLALMQDLRDAVHNAAWPRLRVGVDLMALHKVAVEVYRISDPKKAADWVNARFMEVVNYVGQLQSSDNIVHQSSGQVDNLQPGSWQGLSEILSFLRMRIVQALKTLPTLLGVSESVTQFTSVEWTIYVEGLENLRGLVSELVVWAVNLHLRLLGSTSYAVAEYDRIKTNDALVEANTEAVRILNATNKEKLGYVTHDEGSVEVTGHSAVAEAQPGVIEPLPDAEAATNSPTAGSDSRKGGAGGAVRGPRKQDNSGKRAVPQNPNSEGTTKEERGAKKSTPKAEGLSQYVYADGLDTFQYARDLVAAAARESTRANR